MEYDRYHDYILCNIECYGYCYIDKKTLGDDRYLKAMYELLKNGNIVIDKRYKKAIVVKENKDVKKQFIK